MSLIPPSPIVAAVDLFCGIGGLTHGLQAAYVKKAQDIRIKVRAGFDIDQSCRFAYKKNNRAEFVYKDVKNIKKSDIVSHYKGADVSVLVGCAPCQPFSFLTSNLQKRKRPQTDERWGILRHFSNLIEETNPHIVSMENVPGLLKQSVYEEFLETLESMGYSVWKGVVQCADYGIPQRRKRLVLLASSIGDIALLPPSRCHGKSTVRQALSKSLSTSGKDPEDIGYRLSAKNLERIKASLPGQSRKIWDDKLLAPCHKVYDFPEPYGRMAWDKPAPTITSQFCFYSCGRFGHPSKNRAITIREGALLQSFPKNYRLLGKDAYNDVRTLARQIGNAVPPALGRVIGRSIISHIDTHRKSS